MKRLTDHLMCSHDYCGCVGSVTLHSLYQQFQSQLVVGFQFTLYSVFVSLVSLVLHLQNYV